MTEITMTTNPDIAHTLHRVKLHFSTCTFAGERTKFHNPVKKNIPKSDFMKPRQIIKLIPPFNVLHMRPKNTQDFEPQADQH